MQGQREAAFQGNVGAAAADTATKMSFLDEMEVDGAVLVLSAQRIVGASGEDVVDKGGGHPGVPLWRGNRECDPRMSLLATGNASPVQLSLGRVR